MIKEFEFYHGAVMTRLIHGSKETLSIVPYPSVSNASYVVNGNTGIYIKHSAKRMSPWRFSFQKEHQSELLQMNTQLAIVFLILVCGDDGIVTLSYNDLKLILDDVHGEVEWISASRNPRKEYTVKGSDGQLGRKIGKNDFPRKILAAVGSIHLMP
ncbi:hypothetical protein [Hufsiella ginkgonis]|uniref:DUF4365 domain-containing protein n=1 Tax=Hufsiella ginkgonis TaxID=2695274 RepID=A0A7K1Y0W4_9SPHI|nr:hypothetical protein [Hufsiella ginkgonis]MXV16890.1 hypothetical protein [Hufsiella ginkgonis]